MRKFRPRLSYANVTATLALVAAVAGGSVAVAGVAKAPKNSVVAKSIKNGNVTAKKLTTTVRVSATTNVTDPSPGDNALAVGSVVAKCPEGARAITGGGSVGGNRSVLQSSGPSGTGDSWLVGAGTDNFNPTEIRATVICLISRPGSPIERLP
jgi:hypothetical protein